MIHDLHETPLTEGKRLPEGRAPRPTCHPLIPKPFCISEGRGNKAYYNIESDFVQMPPFEAFRDAESYYAALAHECTHYAVTRIMPNSPQTHLIRTWSPHGWSA
jgi:hypothetical protein